MISQEKSVEYSNWRQCPNWRGWGSSMSSQPSSTSSSCCTPIGEVGGYQGWSSRHQRRASPGQAWLAGQMSDWPDSLLEREINWCEGEKMRASEIVSSIWRGVRLHLVFIDRLPSSKVRTRRRGGRWGLTSLNGQLSSWWRWSPAKRWEDHGMRGSNGRLTVVLVSQWLARLTHGCWHETHENFTGLPRTR